MMIDNLVKVRRDGKVIDESMSIKDIAELGDIEKVVEVNWSNGSQDVSLRDNNGIWVKIISGRNLIAALRQNDKSCESELCIYNADGTLRLSIPNVQVINGKSESGEFGWFEKPRVDLPNAFGVIFEQARDNAQFQLDIDAATGNVLGTYYTR